MSSPVRLPPARWVTQTAAFRRWFGDSKVVDENGEPLVVYHGTLADFSEFKLGKGEAQSNGFFFVDKSNVNTYLYGYLERQKYREDGERPGEYAVMPAYLALKNPKALNTTEDQTSWADPDWENEQIALAKKQGYDGLVIRDDEQDTTFYIAFRAEQIKSAIGNRGTFDLDDPNVLFDRDDRPLETVDPAREFARRPRRRAAGLDEFGLRLFGLRSIDDVLPAYRNLALRPVPAFLRDMDAARALRRELATIDPIASLDDNGARRDVVRPDARIALAARHVLGAAGCGDGPRRKEHDAGRLAGAPEGHGR